MKTSNKNFKNLGRPPLCRS